MAHMMSDVSTLYPTRLYIYIYIYKSRILQMQKATYEKKIKS
jgi:hypothetical protein